MAMVVVVVHSVVEIAMVVVVSVEMTVVVVESVVEMAKLARKREMLSNEARIGKETQRSWDPRVRAGKNSAISRES